MSETVLCCPECESASIQNLVSDPDGEWYCSRCNKKIVEADRREARRAPGKLRQDTLAAELVKAEPEDVSKRV